MSVLLGFPPARPFATDDDYDNAVNIHLQQIDRLFSKETATIASEGINILGVRLQIHCHLRFALN